MESLELQGKSSTLVDLVEEKLLQYLKENNYCIGSVIPNEAELSSSLGVARSVLREALSRLKMIGMIESRTRRGMVIKEPSLLGGMKRLIDPRNLSENTLCDLLEFRMMLEIGMTYKLFENLTDKHLKELEDIVKMEVVFGCNEYSLASEVNFHSKMYENLPEEYEKPRITGFDSLWDGVHHCVAPFSLRSLKKCGLDEMLSVIDSNGKVCFAQSIKAGQESMEISTSGMPAGMYIIRVTDGNKEVDNCRIIIR